MVMESITIATIWYQSLTLLFQQNVELPSLIDTVKVATTDASWLVDKIPITADVQNVWRTIVRYTNFDFRIQFMLTNLLTPLILTCITVLAFTNIFLFGFILLLTIGFLGIGIGVLLLISRSWDRSLQYGLIFIGSGLAMIIVTVVITTILYLVFVKSGLWRQLPHFEDIVNTCFQTVLQFVLRLFVRWFPGIQSWSIYRDKDEEEEEVKQEGQRKIHHIHIEDSDGENEKIELRMMEELTTMDKEGNTTHELTRDYGIFSVQSWKFKRRDEREVRRKQKLRLNIWRVTSMVIIILVAVAGAIVIPVFVTPLLWWHITISSFLVLIALTTFLLLPFTVFKRGREILFWFQTRLIEKWGVFFNAPDQVEQWHIRINLSENPVRALYYSYSWKNRYFKIFILLYKLLLVAVSILLLQFPVYAVSSMLGVHFLFLIILIIFRPYHFMGENFLHLAGTTLCVLNCAYFLLASLKLFELPFYSTYPMLVVNGLFFIFVVLTQVIAAILRVKFTWKYKQIFKLTNKSQSNISKIQMDKTIGENHRSINFSLTRTNMRSLMIFLIGLGILSSICIFICTAGLFYEEIVPIARESVSPLTSSIYGVQGINDKKVDIQSELCATHLNVQFAGYKSWDEFTQNCCCQKSSFYDDRLIMWSPFYGQYSHVELWRCENGVLKHRIRSGTFSDGQSGDGLKIRSFCGRNFTTSAITHGECGELLASGLPNTTTPLEQLYLW